MPLSSAHIPFDARMLLRHAEKARSAVELRTQLYPELREAYAQGCDVIRRCFLADENATRAVQQMAGLVDSIVRVLYEAALRFHKGQEHLSVCAVGGYGRGELFPSSDIDMLFLHDPKKTPAGALAEFVLYGLWDLGLTVGHAVRTVEESMHHAEEDTTIRTNLLDARFLCGGREQFDAFCTQFEAFVTGQSAIDFVEKKLAERDARHLRCGDSRYVLEPNIKDGKGGLRDLQTLFWLAQYIYRVHSIDELVKLHLLTEEEYSTFMKSRDFLWRVRMHIHYIAGRAEERLTFDMQRAVAQAKGYHDESTHQAVERFMKDYFIVARNVGNLTRSVCAVLEEDKKRKPRMSLVRRLQNEGDLGAFHLDGERLVVNEQNVFDENPALLIILFKVAHEEGLDIHPRTLQLVSRKLWLIDAGLRRNDEANNAFMDILLSRKNPDVTLRRMNDAGVLGKFIPDFGKVIGQMQFDMYHVYTVDEHTINAVSILHNTEAGKYKDEMPAISKVFPLIKSRRALYLSMFAHDIAKGRGGDHSVLGEMVVRKLGRRFGFTADEIEACAWLVRYHLLMSRTAFKRDTNDPKTVDDFIAAVQSPERLRLLLALTVADIRAVGPTVWNGWKGALLRDLYYRAEARMGASDGLKRSDEDANLRAELTALLPGWTKAQIEDYLGHGSSSFWQACDAAAHAQVATMLKEIKDTGQPLVLHTRSNSFHAITDVLLCTPDQQGLFSKISGAIALAGANILGAKIFTLKNGMAVEMFHIQDIDAQAFDKPDKIARLSVYINKVVCGDLDIAREIAAQRLTYPSRMEAFKVPPRVFIENKVSANHTVIELGGRDRVGFLYSITKAIADLGLTISTAHITTYGERAVDVFYVKDTFGMKIHHERRIQQIQETLTAAIVGNVDAAKKAG